MEGFCIPPNNKNASIQTEEAIPNSPRNFTLPIKHKALNSLNKKPLPSIREKRPDTAAASRHPQV